MKLFTKHTAYDTLVLGGGGARGVSMLGSLTYLRNYGHLRTVKTFVGTSVGSILAAAMAMDLDPSDIFHSRVLPFKYAKDVNLMNLDASFGLDSGRSLEAFIASVIPAGVSFKDLRKRLVVTATNVSTSSPEYFSARTSPDLEIRKALRMSCSVPIFFNAVRHEGSIYVDGGVSDNFPAAYAISDLGGKSVLGIRFKTSKPAKNPMTFDRFVISLFESSVNRPPPRDMTTLTLNTSTHPLDFNANEAVLLANYNDGYSQTHAYFKKND